VVKELIERVAQFWAGQGLVPEAPATDADIAAWEARRGLAMPRELRAWFTTLNGMGDEGGAFDDELLITFYPLQLFVPLPEDAPSFAEAEDAASYFVFADHLSWSHGYGVRLGGEDPQATPVFCIYAPDLIMPVAPSFGAFLELYLAGDHAALFPDPPAEWTARRDAELARLRAELAERTRVEAPPRISNPDEVTRELSRFADEHGRAHPHLAGSQRVVTLRLRVGIDGVPDHITVDAGADDPALDAEAVRAAERIRFEPATVDGRKVYVWVTFPVTFTFAARPRSLWQKIFGG
jgi:TonB family protein